MNVSTYHNGRCGCYYKLTSSAAEGSTLSSLAWGRVLSTNTACSAFAGSGMSSTYTASPVTLWDRMQIAMHQMPNAVEHRFLLGC